MTVTISDSLLLLILGLRFFQIGQSIEFVYNVFHFWQFPFRFWTSYKISKIWSERFRIQARNKSIRNWILQIHWMNYIKKTKTKKIYTLNWKTRKLLVFLTICKHFSKNFDFLAVAIHHFGFRRDEQNKMSCVTFWKYLEMNRSCKVKRTKRSDPHIGHVQFDYVYSVHNRKR